MLVFRADGNPRIGLGHLSRLLALAEIAGPARRRVFVLGADTPPETQVEVRAAVEEVVVLPSFADRAAEAAWLGANLLDSSAVLVLDGYDFDFAYQQAVRARCGALLYLDDLRAFPQAGDVVLSVAPLTPDQVAAYDLRRPGARLLHGPAWAPLRAPFRAAVLDSPGRMAADPGLVVLCLGGADPANHTRRLAEELAQLPYLRHLHVVVGAAYRHWPALDAWADRQPSERLTLHRALPAPDFCRLLQACGAALLSASTTAYEYASAGGGLLTLLQTADNQAFLYRFMLTEGLARPANALPNLLSAPDVAHIQAALRAAQRRFFDGKASERLRKVLEGLGA